MATSNITLTQKTSNPWGTSSFSKPLGTMQVMYVNRESFMSGTYTPSSGNLTSVVGVNGYTMPSGGGIEPDWGSHFKKTTVSNTTVWEFIAPHDGNFYFYAAQSSMMWSSTYSAALISPPNASSDYTFQQAQNNQDYTTSAISMQSGEAIYFSCATNFWGYNNASTGGSGDVVVWYSTPASSASSGAYEYVSADGTSLTWEQANTAAIARGGTLAVAKTSADLQELNDYLDTVNYGVGAWIGLKRDGADWKWVDGSVSTTFNWLGGEPNNAFGNENYVHILSNGIAGSTNHNWNDIDNAASNGSHFGSPRFGYIIEYESTAEIFTSEEKSVNGIREFLNGKDGIDIGASNVSVAGLFSNSLANDISLPNGNFAEPHALSEFSGANYTNSVMDIISGDTTYFITAYDIMEWQSAKMQHVWRRDITFYKDGTVRVVDALFKYSEVTGAGGPFNTVPLPDPATASGTIDVRIYNGTFTLDGNENASGTIDGTSFTTTKPAAGWGTLRPATTSPYEEPFLNGGPVFAWREHFAIIGDDILNSQGTAALLSAELGENNMTNISDSHSCRTAIDNDVNLTNPWIE